MSQLRASPYLYLRHVAKCVDFLALTRQNARTADKHDINTLHHYILLILNSIKTSALHPAPPHSTIPPQFPP